MRFTGPFLIITWLSTLPALGSTLDCGDLVQVLLRNQAELFKKRGDVPAELFQESYANTIKLLNTKGVLYREDPELAAKFQIELLASDEGAPINRYLRRLEKKFSVKARYYVDLKGLLFGHFASSLDGDHRLSLGVQSLINELNFPSGGNHAGTPAHEFIHGLFQRYRFAHADQGSLPLPSAFFAQVVGRYGGGYESSAAFDEILAQQSSALATLVEVLRQRRRGLPEGGAQIQTFRKDLVRIQENFETIQRHHAQGFGKVLKRMRGARVSVVVPENLPRSKGSLYSKDFFSELESFVKYEPNSLGRPSIAFVENDAGGAYVVAMAHSSTYVIPASLDLKEGGRVPGSRVIPWLIEQVESVESYIEKLNGEMHKAIVALTKLESSSTVEESVLAEIRGVIRNLREARRESGLLDLIKLARAGSPAPSVRPRVWLGAEAEDIVFGHNRMEGFSSYAEMDLAPAPTPFSPESRLKLPSAYHPEFLALSEKLSRATSYEEGLPLIKAFLEERGLIATKKNLVLYHGSSAEPEVVLKEGLWSYAKVKREKGAKDILGQRIGDGIYAVGKTWIDSPNDIEYNQYSYEITLPSVRVFNTGNFVADSLAKLYIDFRMKWGLPIEFDGDQAVGSVRVAAGLGGDKRFFRDFDLGAIVDTTEVLVKTEVIPPAQIRALPRPAKDATTGD